MDPLPQLTISLGLSAGKFLFKLLLGQLGSTDSGEVGGDALADVAKDRIKDVMDRRAAGRKFEDLGDDIARRVVADLKDHHLSITSERLEPVLNRVQIALAGNVTADFVVHNRADSARLFTALKAVPVHGQPPLSDHDEPVLDDALRTAARYLAAVDNKLPRFDAVHVRQTLDLLATLRADFDSVMDDVRTIRDTVEQIGGPAREVYEADYRQAVVQALDWVELFGADLRPELRRVRLTDAYVTLALADQSDEPSDDLPPVHHHRSSL